MNTLSALITLALAAFFLAFMIYMFKEFAEVLGRPEFTDGREEERSTINTMLRVNKKLRSFFSWDNHRLKAWRRNYSLSGQLTRPTSSRRCRRHL